MWDHTINRLRFRMQRRCTTRAAKYVTNLRKTSSDEYPINGLFLFKLQHIHAAKLIHSKTVHTHPVDLPHSSGSFSDQQIYICPTMMMSGVVIMIYIFLRILREFIQIYQQKWQYLFEPNNFISWMLYVSAAIMVSPIFNGGWITDNHFSASSITVFLSWFNLLLFLQRFDQVSCSSILRIYASKSTSSFIHDLHFFIRRLASMWSCFWRSYKR